jgi:hypothetical protein
MSKKFINLMSKVKNQEKNPTGGYVGYVIKNYRVL